VTITEGKEFLVVDADTHYSEPWDLWTSRAPSNLKERVPHVEDVDGVYHWVFDGHVANPARAASVIDRAMVKQLGTEFLFSAYIDSVAPASYRIADRLVLMDQLNIWAQLVYPNAIGFGGQQLGNMGDENVRLLAVQIFNDAMAEMQEVSGHRLFPMGVLPWWNLDLTLREIQRIKDLGLVGVNTVADPQDYGLPALSEPAWTPMFTALEETDLTLNFHIGASATQHSYFGTAPWPTQPEQNRMAIGSAMIYLGNARVLANFIFGGIFERHPQLRFVSVESGIGWIPFFLQALDYQLTETAPDSVKELSLTPTEYFRRQCAACFWFEKHLLLENVHYLGIDNCLFETDFPHPTCLYPNPVERILQTLEGESDEVRRKLLGENAARVYRLSLPMN
jgi:predicted TIM-barrel fold metal-dependent hydrolase